MGSMHTGLEDRARDFPKLAAYFAERAAGGVGLIVTGGFSPNVVGWLKPFGGKLSWPWEVRPHRHVTGAVHAHCAKICLQLLHAGRYAYHPLSVAPSKLKAPLNPFTTLALSALAVDRQIAAYARAARLARDAGYNGVEVMGPESYLIKEFTAARTNQRSEAWGGSMRFAVEIVLRIREACGPDFIIIYRLSLVDLVEDGNQWQEILAQAQAIKAAGATITNSRYRLARGAHSDHRRLGAARGICRHDRKAQAAPAHSGGGDQPHQHAGSGRSHSGRRRSRHGVAGSSTFGRPAMGQQGQRRPIPHHQHMHRLQPGLPGSCVRQQAGELPGQPTRGARNRADLHANQLAQAHRGGRCRPCRVGLRDGSGRARPPDDLVRCKR